MSMEYEWDKNKAKTNQERHKVPFESVNDFCWDDALIGEDTRKNYQEIRYRALGPIGDRLYLLVYTMREEIVRVISLRKANKREFNYYVTQIDSTY